MTRPADAAVADDDVAPPPQHEVRDRSRARAKRTRAAQLEGVVDGREQVGRAADAHRREPGERLVARRLDADPALDVRPDGDRRRTAASPSRGDAAGASLDRPPRPAAARGAATASDEVGDGVGGSRADPARGRRRTSRGAPPGRRGCAAASSSASASNASSSTSRAAPASTSSRALARWWPAACGYGTTTMRQAEGGRPRPASTSRPDRRRGRRRPGPRACRRAGTGAGGSARAGPPGRASRRGQRRGVAVVAGHVDDGDALDEPRQGLGDRGVEPADGLRPAEDRAGPAARRAARAATRAASRSTSRVSRIGVPVT